jgi:hypothetical protein
MCNFNSTGRLRLRGINFHIADKLFHYLTFASFQGNPPDLPNEERRICRTFIASELNDDPQEEELPLFDIGEDTAEELDAARCQLIESAHAQAMSSSGLERLNTLLDVYRDVFRLKLSAAPTAPYCLL